MITVIGHHRAVARSLASPHWGGIASDSTAAIPASTADKRRKRVIGIIAGILVARHLKTTEDLFDSKPSPRSDSMIAAAVQWIQ